MVGNARHKRMKTNRYLSPKTNLLSDLAPKFDLHLRQAATTILQPWQQEIRDYVSTAKKPTNFAQRNLVEWGKRKGLVN
jgi:hypothetical protein